MAKDAETPTIYTKKDGSKTLTRHVYTASDDVAARFEGFFPPAGDDDSDKPATSAKTGTKGAGSPANAANNAK